MKKTFDASPMPNHKMIIGNRASGGTGRRSSTTGSTVSSIQRVRPTSIPRTMPTGAAASVPSSTRPAET
jgi:hypothetical protein